MASLSLSSCGVDRALRVASSLTAHELCSQTFVAGRDTEAVFHEYVQPFIGVPVVQDALRYEVNRRRDVTASIARLVLRARRLCRRPWLHGHAQIKRRPGAHSNRAVSPR